jgi:hypothetical protein
VPLWVVLRITPDNRLPVHGTQRLSDKRTVGRDLLAGCNIAGHGERATGS